MDSHPGWVLVSGQNRTKVYAFKVVKVGKMSRRYFTIASVVGDRMVPVLNLVSDSTYVAVVSLIV